MIRLQLSPFHASYFAHELTRLGEIGDLARLSTTLFDSKVDLNPHQVEAALFALSNPLQRGVILADEVGLGKTIEAGLVLCQRWAERRRHLIVVCPAHIRKQWQTELSEKFNLPSIVMDRRVWSNARRAGSSNPFDSDAILVISYGFAARMKDDLRAVPFDLVVMDEAHKLRNAYQPSRKGGQAVRWAFELRQKLLLTATPLQNTLLELYGLGWLIDEHIFGDRSAFQSRYCSAGGDLVGLRTRLAQFCKRTLRRDCTYVNYTRRQAMTHPFPQTDEERAIHRDVMSFVTREFSFSLPQRQRQLIEMILFKTLASSPQALAGTLRTIRQRLIDLRDGLSQEESALFIEALAADEDLDADAFAEEFEDLDWLDPDGTQPPPDGRALAIELAEVDALIARAERLNGDSKSVALIDALRAAFSKLEDVGALRKALIFTESRRTQDFLAEFLEANGYAGRVVTFNGSNSHPRAKAAYERFMQKYAGSDKITGSKAVDIRTALIEEFRERGEILLATEAAAEGVNLQFCSLVVNYDLPWNPQRIEQRIGRCHRYGQKHDVVVVNFLSQDNVADKRVHDLLQQKFSLFDGLFGASDEVLGAIEDGIDFERRILAILKNCRTDGEIEAAFNALQLELEETISAKMTQARQQLLDHFDADVHERLKVRGEEAKLALDRVGERFWKLAHWGLDDARRAHSATFDDEAFTLSLSTPPEPTIPVGTYRLISAARGEPDGPESHLLRLSSPLGQWLLTRAKSQSLTPHTVRFNVSAHHRRISVLRALLNRGGWLRLDKLTLHTEVNEEFLLLTMVDDDGKNLDQETAQHLFDVGAEARSPIDVPADATSRLDVDATRLAEATLVRAIENSNTRFRAVQEQINRWAEDKIQGAEVELDSIKRELRAARRQAEMAETNQLRQEAEERVSNIERHQRRKRQAIFDLEDEVEGQRSKLISDLKQRVAHRSERQALFTLRWEVV